ncbi:hypothetical protein VQ056_11775 [Paenibacillus sp. JTLBN-2024]
MKKYGVKPDWPWMEDEKEGLGTADFRASKTNVNYASLLFGKSRNRISVQGDGSGAVKASLNADGSVPPAHPERMVPSTQASRGWVEANPVQKPIAIDSGYTGTVRMKLALPMTISISTFADAPQYLSDMQWSDATSGWSRVKRIGASAERADLV